MPVAYPAQGAAGVDMCSSFRPASSIASIACRIAGEALSNFNAVFIVHELSFASSPSTLLLTPNKSFGIISRAWHKIRNTGRCDCACAAFIFLDLLKAHAKGFTHSVWLTPNFTRCMRMTEPIFLSIRKSLRAMACLQSKYSDRIKPKRKAPIREEPGLSQFERIPISRDAAPPPTAVPT